MNNSFLKNLFVWFIIFASLMGAYQIISEGKKQYSDLKYSEFLNVVESDQVLQVEIKGKEKIDDLKTIALEANVGDIILLSRYLIHCSLPNKSKNSKALFGINKWDNSKKMDKKRINLTSI